MGQIESRKDSIYSAGEAVSAVRQDVILREAAKLIRRGHILSPINSSTSGTFYFVITL